MMPRKDDGSETAFSFLRASALARSDPGLLAKSDPHRPLRQRAFGVPRHAAFAADDNATLTG